jgi:PAS domain S-box-containing protein
MGATLTELILDRAHSAVVSMDERGVVTYWNPSAESSFGIPRDQALGRVLADLIIPERLREAHRVGLQRFLRDGVGPVLDRRVELAALRADGSEFPVEITISALRDGGRWTFHAFVQDISDRRESERDRERLVDELSRALHGSQRRFDAIVGELSDPVTIRNRDHHIVYANRAALAHLGFGSVEELERTPPAEIMADYLVLSEDGGEVTMDDIPSVRLLRGEAPEPLLIQTVNRRTGAHRWNLLKSAPLLDQAGAVEATIMIIEDVTEQKRAERQGTFLAQVSGVLASSLDYEQTFRNVAQLAVPDIADWCAVDLVDPDGDREPVAVAHVDPRRLRLAEQLREYEPEHPDPDRGLGLVFRSGRRVFYPEITDEMLVVAAVDERHLELLRAVGLRSAAIIPMRVGARVLGAMTLVSADSGRLLDESDLELAEQVAARAAVAIENARLYSERSVIAHTLQQSLLPDELPEVPGYELAAAYIPAVASSDVGGDFYDAWEVGESWMVIIGDVTGKGVQAAARTALVRHTIRAASEYESSPAALLSRVDSILKRQRTTSICTALCIRIEKTRAVIAVGGHPLALHISKSGVRPLGAYGPLLGAFAEAVWEDHTVELAPGSTLLAYTDGVTDAIGEGGARYGTTRLQETLTRCRDRSAAAVIDSLTTALADFQVGAHADDTAALAVHRKMADGSRGQTQVADAAQLPEVTTVH